jgi:hypothetical protein
MIRVLVAIAPSMYQQTLTLFLRRRRPDLEVKGVDPVDLERECAHFEPHLLVCHDGVSEEIRSRALARIEILYSDSLDALVKMDGRDSRLEDISIEGLLAIVDETEKRVSERRG